jgi:saccharopine dehydrogenase-like NADP-dependent oxidoreductase
MKTMKCIILGGSGEVGGEVVQELLRSDICSELTIVGRRDIKAL